MYLEICVEYCHAKQSKDHSIHDANLENVEYNCKEDSIKIKLVNPIFGVQIDLIFLNIGLALVTKGD